MISLIDDISERVGRHYKGFLVQLTGLYAQTIDAPAPTAPALRTKFNIQAHEAQVMLLSTVGQLVNSGVDGTLADIQRSNTPLNDERLTTMVREISEARAAALTQISAASQRDVMMVSQSLSQFSLHVDAIMNARALPYSSAVFEAKMAIKPNFVFSQIDRGGRKWASTVFARTTMRAFLVKTNTESRLFAMASYGVDLAKIQHPESTHQHNGLVFSIGGAAGHPAYTDIRDAVFHPNSRATVGMA